MDITSAKLSPLDIIADYERRSLAHVAGMPEQLEAPGLWRGIAFRLGDAFLVSSIGEVAEILRVPALTAVPGTKAWLLGIANVRGNLICVIHLKGFLEGEPFKPNERTRVLVVRQQGGNVGLIVDEVLGQRSFVDENRREQKHYLDSPVSRYLSLEYQQGQVTWGVLGLANLVKSPEFMQASA